jgi:malate dehydrogenase (oxaloacetate-decarboxylating)
MPSAVSATSAASSSSEPAATALEGAISAAIAAASVSGRTAPAMRSARWCTPPFWTAAPQPRFPRGLPFFGPEPVNIAGESIVEQSPGDLALQPSASYSITLRVLIPQRPGSFARVAGAIGNAGAILGGIDLVRVDHGQVIRDITFLCADAAHGEAVVNAVRALEGVEAVSVSDRTFLLHVGGKIEVVGQAPVKNRDDLSMAYTPGVARVCSAIQDDVSKAWTLTIKANTVAVVTDGSAVLGLGDIGPHAAMPVMEGKAMLFKEFAGVDAFPLCLATQDVDDIVNFVKMVSPTFGGVNLEDIAAPRCFEIERRLQGELDIPVFHDDQHGTAIVVLAALLNGLRVVAKRAEDVRVVIVGAGAAGIASAEVILAHGVGELLIADIDGVLYPGRPNMDPIRAELAQRTNPSGKQGAANDVIPGADVVIGLSGPRSIAAAAVRQMATDPIVFAMANPVPEVQPEEVGADVAIMATGRSDYPNQINNVLAFPGVFRGALDVRASAINEEMKLAAARAIAGVIVDDELHAEYIIPSVFNRRVVEAIAEAVADAAVASGVARRSREVAEEEEALRR